MAPSGFKAPAPPGWLRIAYEGVYGGTDWAVVHWYKLAPIVDPTLAELNTMVDLIADEFADNLIEYGHISNQVQLTTVKARYSNVSAPDVTKTVRVAAAVGTGSSSPTPGQVCYLIDWQTNDGRRGGKPRSYIPGVQAGDMADEAHLTTGVQAAYTTQAQTYITNVNALSSSPWTSVFFIDASFVNAKAYRLTPRDFTVNGAVVSNVVGTQRRRVDRLRISA